MGCRFRALPDIDVSVDGFMCSLLTPVVVASTCRSADQKPGLYVNVPTLMPKHYNTTLNPVTLDLYLDPICRYRVR